MKKYIVIVLVSLMVFTGCSTNPNKGRNEEQPSRDSNQSQERLRTKSDNPFQGEITISLVRDTEFVDVAAQMFMDKYPDTKINVLTFATTEYVETGDGAVMSVAPTEEFSQDAYLKQLNTKIMSGNAEDIIMTNPLPMNKYSEMDIFEDLTPYINSQEDINNDNYFMNMINLGKTSKGQFEMPVSTFYEIISFDKELVIDSGITLGEDVKCMMFSDAIKMGIELVDKTDRENTYLAMGSASGMAYTLIMESIGDFINFKDKTVSFDSEKYTEILEYAKKLDDNGYFDKGTIDFYNMEYHFALDTDFPNQAAAFTLYDDSIRYHSMPICDKNGDAVGRMGYRFGINSKSKNKDLAWEFLRFLLGEEVQGSPSFHMTGVNKNAFEVSATRYAKMMISDEYSFDIQEYIDLLWSWHEQILVNQEGDSFITGSIYEENEAYFEGNKTAKETGKSLQNRIDRYLNE